MKHTNLLLPLLLGSTLLVSCTKTGDASPVTPEPGPGPLLFDVNTMTEMRLTSISEPMVWGGNYRDPLMDSIIPGTSTHEKTEGTLAAECVNQENWYSYVNYVPLYQDKDVFLSRIHSVKDEVELLNPGKLMVLENWKFVTDVNRGIHIYNDSDPANPVKVGFIMVPGVLDIALKNKVIYANAYSGLVSIDIADPQKAKAIDLIPAAFPDVYSWNGPMMDSLGNVAVAWRADTVYTCYVNRWKDGDVVYDEMTSGGVTEVPTTDGAEVDVLGQNASMSRFAISSDWLYTVDNSALRLFDIRSERTPKKGPIVETGAWDLETIFKSGDGLFLGSMTGMYIYDHSAGGTPVQASTYSHITSCDPVVVQDGIAYVTLRSGQRCANGKNELNVLDVKDLYNPKLLSTLPMSNPAGLAVKDSTLFVCEGSYGLAVLDIQDPSAPKEISRVADVNAEDVIANAGILTLIGPSGIWRLSYEDRTNLEELSFTAAEAPVEPEYPIGTEPEPMPAVLPD